MSSPTPDDILREHQFLHEEALAFGSKSFFVFPHHFIPVFILILTLLVPWPRQGLLSYARYLSFLFIAWFTACAIPQVQTLGLASGYGVGLILAWFLVWSAALLVFNNPQREYARIEKCMHGDCVSIASMAPSKGGGSAVFPVPPQRGESAARCRDRLNDAKDANQSRNSIVTDELEESHFKWQPFPETLAHRLYWVLDLVFNFRGPGWNWRITTLQPLPFVVRLQLEGTPGTGMTPKEFDLDAAKSTLRTQLKMVTWGYLVLDVARPILTKDPYFLGIIPSQSPYLSALDPESPLTRTLNFIFHQGTSLCVTIIAIQFVAAAFWAILLSAVILCSLLVGTRFAIPIEQPWMYPEFFGPCLLSILDRGLAGVWATWWHQLFRFTYVSVGKWTISCLPANLQRKPNFTRPLRILIAFILSGFLHSMGSYTQVSSTHPFSGTFLFFLLQAPGIFFQSIVARYLNEHLPFRVPRWLRRAGNLVFVVLWFCLTGPLEGDDLARCGLWLLEPVPFSLVDALGYGDGKGPWRWTWKWVQVWRGEQWWNRGILIL